MPKTIVDAVSFDTVTAPDDGDPANGATFQLAPQALANRTRYLLQNTLQSTSPTTFTRMIPLSRGRKTGSGTNWYLSSSYISGVEDWECLSGTHNEVLSFDFQLPKGATLTQLRSGVGITGGTPSVGMQMRAWVQTPNKTSTPGDGTSIALGSAQSTTAAVGKYLLTIPGLAYVSGSDTDLVIVQFLTSDSNSATYPDTVYWLEATFTHSNPLAYLVAL